MSTPKVGERVGALINIEDGVARLLGFGVYEGDFVPDENVAGFGPMLRQMKKPNPKLKLDNGDIVWGCECWWGSEDEIQREIAACKVEQVRIGLLRSECAPN